MARLIEAEVWEYRPSILTAAAELVLMRLADSAGTDHRMVWIGEQTLITDTRKDRSTVYDALFQLRELNILRTVPEGEIPPEARRYASVVRQILPVDEWAVAFKGGRDVVQDDHRTLQGWKAASRRKKPKLKSEPDFEQPELITQDMIDDAAAESDPPTVNHGVEGSEIQPESVGFPDPSQEQNQELREEETTSLLPSRRGATKGGKAAKVSEDAGLDVADQVYAAGPAPAPRTGRRPGPDTGPGLVEYFANALRATSGGRSALLVHDPINRAAMAAALNRWKRQGATPDQIRAWMIIYADTCGSRKSVVPPWKDFLARRVTIIRQASEAAESKIRHDPDHPDFASYWGLTPEEAAQLVTPLEQP